MLESATEYDVNWIVEYTKQEIKIKKIEESPISGNHREILIESHDWGDDSIKNTTMEVVFTEPIDDEGDPRLLRQGVSDFEREVETPDTEPDTEPEEDFWENIDLGIQESDGDIMLNGDTSSRTDLVNFVEHLFDQGYISAEDVPIESGYKWNLINTEPEHQNGDDMYHEEKIQNADTDIWLETKYSTAQIKSNIKSLSEEFV